MTAPQYVLLGRSGLRVSQLCLGTMTFGTEWGYGSPEETARTVLDRYLDAGGNFLDTADLYTNGTSETMLGKFLAEGHRRERVVLATKYTFNARAGDPNAGGNGRKNMTRAVEGSLRRLRTDYIDLYWMHCWDRLTPIEEVMSSLDALVRSGKVRYVGFSNVPAWYLGRAQTLAELRGWEKLCALQLEYSLVERTIEREYVPAALELGMGICSWSPLGGGLLSGKYKGRQGAVQGEGRLKTHEGSDHPAFNKFSERNFTIADAVVGVAKELGRSPAQVALNWIARRPGIASTIIGASKLEQLDDNLAALSFEIPPVLAAHLEKASAPPPVYPYYYFDESAQRAVTGGVQVKA